MDLLSIGSLAGLLAMMSISCTVRPIFQEQTVELDQELVLAPETLEVRTVDGRDVYYAMRTVDGRHELQIYPQGDSPFVVLVDLTTGQACPVGRSGQWDGRSDLAGRWPALEKLLRDKEAERRMNERRRPIRSRAHDSRG